MCITVPYPDIKDNSFKNVLLWGVFQKKSYLSVKINWLYGIMFSDGNNVEKMTGSCLLQWQNEFLPLVIISPYIHHYILLHFFIILIYFIAQDSL